MEYGEPAHLIGIVLFLIFLSFMFGVMWGSVSKESENEQKNSN